MRLTHAPAVLLVVILWCAPQRCLALSQVEVLLSFKASFTNGDDVLSSWDGSDPCCCQPPFTPSAWLGVICDDTGNVSYLQLPQAGLQGSIPPAGYPLPDSLQYLSIFGNSIQGTIPGEWRLPPSLLGFSLFDNQISGTIPAEWSLPDTLTVIYLNGNRLSGIPDNWRLPASLKQLYLYDNLIRGNEWTTVAWPDGLTELQLNSNQLTGTLAADWRLPASLTMLRVANNGLTGSLPTTWGLPNALDVSLAGNQLAGPLPAGWVFPRTLRGLDLASNLLNGTIPAWDIPMSVSAVSLSNNLLVGTVPAWNSSHNNTLTYIHPGNDGLCGEVPTSSLYMNFDTKELVTSLPSCDAPSSSNTAVVVGAVVGGVVGLVLVAGLAWWWVRRRRGSQISYLSKPAVAQDQKLLASDALLASITSKLSASLSSSSTSATGSTRAAHSKGQPGVLSKGGVDQQFHIPFQDLEFKRQIGAGAFGRVYLAKWNETLVAAKLLLGPAASMGNVDDAADMVLSLASPVVANLQQEAHVMAGLRHPHVLNFIGLSVMPPCLVSEYCPRGSLYSTLLEARNSPELAAQLDWVVRLRLAMGTALGMLYLHSRNPPLVHRDLKSPNLLIGHNWTIKVADFNLSKIMGEVSVDSSTTSVTNPRWLAPEVLAGETHTFASDVYSFGLVLWELMAFQVPYEEATNPWQVVTNVIAGRRPAIPSPDQLIGGGFPGLDGYVELINKCWAQSPADRPSFNDIITDIRKLIQMAVTQNNPNTLPASQGTQDALVDNASAGRQGAEVELASTGTSGYAWV